MAICNLKNYGALLALATLTLTSFAGERFPFLNAAGLTYSNVLVTSVTATDLYFSHAGGMGNVKLKQLDEALQKRFNYNATNAANAANAQAVATRAFYMQKAGEKPPVIVEETETVLPTHLIKGPVDVRVDWHVKHSPDDEVNAKRFLGKVTPAFDRGKMADATTEHDR